MHIGANLRGAFGEVLVEVHLANQGQTAGLSTVQRTPGTLTTESWDLIWTRDEYGDLAIGEVNCETGRATQRYNYAGETPFLCAEPTDLEIAAIGNLGLRAAQHFGDLAAAITDAGDALQVSGFRLQIPFTPRRSVSPAIVTPIM